MIVQNHNHVTGKYRGSAHEECNLNFSLNKKVSVVFHKLQNFDSHLVFQEIRKCNFKINVLPKTINIIRVLLFSNLKRKAINPNNLVKNLGENHFYHLSQEFNVIC